MNVIEQSLIHSSREAAGPRVTPTKVMPNPVGECENVRNGWGPQLNRFEESLHKVAVREITISKHVHTLTILQ